MNINKTENANLYCIYTYMYIPWPVCNKKKKIVIVEVAHAVYACVYELNTIMVGYDIIIVYCSISAAVATHFSHSVS